MVIQQHAFETIDWSKIEKVKHAGEKGYAVWQTTMMGDIRIRMVAYSEGYVADHWCNKGHIIFCVKGKMRTALQDGRILKLKKGMTYHVGDNSEAHRTSSKKGCRLFIVD